MEESEKNKLLFDDRELEELSDEEIDISVEKQKELKDEVDKYFQENKIEYED
ncbi:MAG: hypothetical protein HFJ12_01550 [Bacilli bacterium]|nr:hypothetical protein [Bacilli bacterium]